ncbi:hypothetical protein BPMI_00797 [Candidatus Burkholderia pumila]|uniref:Uncharacterized protein n=1 Tax=Candidatus Burkholderia pumila TaxID=1090375 RepID=A0ABR5HL22_9BURK|nr:hypothetical protein BPMI_00797 [Candidatus Burkholderia pumila]
MRRIWKSAWLAASMLCVTSARALPDADAQALSLADTATATVSAPSNWRGSFETAAANYNTVSQADRRDLNDTIRVASSLSYDAALTGGWRVFFSKPARCGLAGRKR